MTTNQEATRRFAELVAAMVEIAGNRGDITLRGAPAPLPLGFAVRLQPHPWTAGVELLLWPGGARVAHWSSDGRRVLHMEREMKIELDDGYQWECLVFPDAPTLAVALLQRLQNELDGALPR